MKASSLQRRNIAALAVTIFGTVAMLGDLTGCLPLLGIGAASTIAPFPKVFCDNQGLEGFASEFTIEFDDADGRHVKMPLTPEIYARMRGPYNRRNVYGAAFSFGPKLPPELWRSVFAHGLGPAGTLREEFGLPANATNIVIVIHTKTTGRSDQWELRL